MKMNRFISARREVRKRITSNKKYDGVLHKFIIIVLLVNTILILYVMLAVTLNMTLSGVSLIDSIPIALYILPLMVFLPLMILAYHRDRSAAWNFPFLIICTVFFGMLSLLIHGFLICLFLNLMAGVIIFILGRFRPRTNLRQAGRRGIAFILLLNILGLTFPISIVVMGQSTIATTTMDDLPQISLSIPLSDFDYPYQNLTPTTELLSDITSNSFSVDFRILEDDMQSWVRLRSWLVVLNDSTIEYSITLTPNRSALVDVNAQTLATTELIEAIYHEHRDALSYLTNTTLSDITHLPQSILFDLTLSRHEWQMLMLETRSLDLIGFSSLMRTSIFSVNLDRIENEATLLHNDIVTSGMNGGILVEPFVIDDLQDADTTSMRVCGVTSATLGLWAHASVFCQRSRFSFEMQGDVGEYLVHSYSGSISRLGPQWSMRMGNIGNSTDVSGRVDSVYESIDALVNDIVLAAGNGVRTLTLDSLPSLLNTFGVTGITQLRNSIDAVVFGSASYTFRIFAFRAVFMAIDAFDFLML